MLNSYFVSIFSCLDEQAQKTCPLSIISACALPPGAFLSVAACGYYRFILSDL